jgi:hypothetical protein
VTWCPVDGQQAENQTVATPLDGLPKPIDLDSKLAQHRVAHPTGCSPRRLGHAAIVKVPTCVQARSRAPLSAGLLAYWTPSHGGLALIQGNLDLLERYLNTCVKASLRSLKGQGSSEVALDRLVRRPSTFGRPSSSRTCPGQRSPAPPGGSRARRYVRACRPR